MIFNLLPAVRSSSATALRGWRLKLARAVWGVGAIFAVALFLAYIPINQNAVRGDWLVQNAAAAVAPTIYFGAFANYVLTLRYVAAAISFGVAALIVWRKSDDAVALLVALGLLLLPNMFFTRGNSGYIYGLYGLPWHIWLPQLRDGLNLFGFYYIALLFSSSRMAVLYHIG